MRFSPEQLSDYNDKGFLIVRGVFDSLELEPLQTALENDPTVGGALYGMTGDTSSLQHVCFWTDCGDDLVGTIPRIERMATATTSLLGDESYHWHSKLVVKPPGSTRGRWHQDFGSWYDDGVPGPNMLTAGVAVTESTQQNGCTMVVPYSHKRGRLNPPQQKGEETVFNARRDFAIKEHGIVHCELHPGDAVFFHANLLHASGSNESSRDRVVMFCSYNARSNAPITNAASTNEAGAYMNITKAERAYRPLDVVEDDSISRGAYRSLYNDTIFKTPKFDLPSNYTRAVALPTEPTMS